MFSLQTARVLNVIRAVPALKHAEKLYRYNVPQITSYFTTSSSFTQSEKLELKIDDSAVTQLKSILDSNEFLRVIVEGGGCSGFQYKFEVDKCIEEDEDITFTKDGVKIVCDEESLKILNGSRVEFHKDMLRAGFRVVDIPQAEQGCSCGVSFSVKL